ncbi:MAG: hypothetical protein QXE31_04350 [Candidatus Woesearchaeota archaeon]
MATEASLIIMPAFILGVVVGIIEMFFVHSDEIGMGWFSHGLHAFPFAILFTFVSMNIDWALHFIKIGTSNIFIHYGAIAVVSIIAMLKISAAAAIAGRVGERFEHTLMIGAIIFVLGILARPIASIILPLLPSTLRF